MKCPKCGCKTLANENTQGVWSCGTKSWSYCSDVIESPRCLRNQLKQRTAERDELLASMLEEIAPPLNVALQYLKQLPSQSFVGIAVEEIEKAMKAIAKCEGGK